RDYQRIAQLHLAAGWIPAHVRVDELESAVRTVCEPYFTRPLSEISLAEVVAKLFSVARRYQLTLQPQLILLQKTLLNIEGIGRLLHPQIDIWATAKPVLAQILRERHSPRRLLRKLRARMPEWVSAAPEMPQLVHTFLKKAAAGDFDAARNVMLEQRERDTRALRRQLAVLPLAAASLLCAALLYAFDNHGAQWLHVPVSAWIALVVSAIAFSIAWWRAR
ncbi:MAG: ubiquinone biosynthesis regulatory protein kinase UbiB, partial [Rudaea sp.]